MKSGSSRRMPEPPNNHDALRHVAIDDFKRRPGAANASAGCSGGAWSGKPAKVSSRSFFKVSIDIANDGDQQAFAGEKTRRMRSRRSCVVILVRLSGVPSLSRP